MNDLRCAWRQLVKNPGFSAVVVATLALGIGGTTAMFSIVNALLFKPLDVPQPKQLVRIYSPSRTRPETYHGFSYLNFVDLRQQNQVFAGLAAVRTVPVTLLEGERPRQLFVNGVSARYFATMGCGLWRGREFSLAEERDPHQAPVAIVSHAYWKQHGADPDLIGKSILLNGRSHTLVGIAAKGFVGHSVLLASEVWIPLNAKVPNLNKTSDPAALDPIQRRSQDLFVIGRLKAGLQPDQAESQLKVLADQLVAAYPDENRDFALGLGPLDRLSSGHGMEFGPMDPPEFKFFSLLLMTLSGIVLLIACWNVANLLLARAAARRREMAMRLALGSGRGLLLRQLLVEGLLLSLLGGAAGLLVAFWVADLVAAAFAASLPAFGLGLQTGIDGRVLLVVLVVCVVSTLLAALSPAWQTSHSVGLADLKDQTGPVDRQTAGLGLFSTQSLRVIGQVAVCTALVMIAGAILRQLYRSRQADPGFTTEHRLFVDVDPWWEGAEANSVPGIFEAVEERLRHVPGVECVAPVLGLPSAGGLGSTRVWPAEQAGPDLPDNAGSAETGSHFMASGSNVGSDFFRALGLPLLRGRTFESTEILSGFDRSRKNDTGSQPPGPVIIDQTLAQQLWPGQNPLGRLMTTAEVRRRGPSRAPATLQVVGLVAATRPPFSDQKPTPRFYQPFNRAIGCGAQFVVKVDERAGGTDRSVATAIWRELRSSTTQLPIQAVQTLEASRDSNPAWVMGRAFANLFLGFGLLALLLSTSGIYGLNSFVVACRTREIGVRVALGATRGKVLWMILRNGLAMTVAGMGIGMFGAWGLSRLLQAAMSEFRFADFWVVAFIPLVLAAVSLLACYVPARRAARVDPMVALRYE